MHISYSELKTWAECPYKRKLIYQDRIKKFIGNNFTAFGRALHFLCENLVHDKVEDPEDFFNLAFEKELETIGKEEDDELTTQMREQAGSIHPQIMPELTKNFGEFEVFSVEEKLYENIDDGDVPYKFKGFIDLVIKTEDGKYHIIDWKTCSWGWDAKKRSDKYIAYQLTLYKKYFCTKHNIDPKKVETYFGLLKRTAKKDNVEIFRVTSGPRKVDNATKLLTTALIHISKGNHVKDRRSCAGCEFRKTEHCR
tara:strand:- start:273 stop:1031 length:759 start_codon:yes stop_codon:yes gene_type:complete